MKTRKLEIILIVTLIGFIFIDTAVQAFLTALMKLHE